ncbi:uncharacterized protein LOC128555552 [Mercenaria mercenaria]|uniref:uncharacterized protein LOC128555552 n=1 Tax=Mercenaria mercenaria TaxID=6596 RepID=UPI00234E93C4|nr:uncharacterized protein LOC128555552 [Mercenaria mercenaria]
MILELYDEFHGGRYDDKTKSRSTIAVSKAVYKATAAKCIPFGVKIYFILLTPEQISPFSFDLVDRALYLICLTYKTVNVKNYERLIEREHDLSLLVSQRLILYDNAIFKNDRPDYVAVENGMLACDYLYVGKATAAENCLKTAILCVLKSDDLGLRLLCKLITYITWYCLVKNNNTSLDNLKVLLENGLESFECDFRSLRGFPLESLGYLYYVYSRYYMTMWDKMRGGGHDHRNYTTERSYRFKAVEKAKQSVKIFQEDHKEKKSAETLRRLILAKCQQAYALLGCGHDFNTSEEVSMGEITEAENMISSMKSDMSEMPLVQNVNYLIALCDVQYRKGNTSKALKTARKCLEKSRIKSYYVVLCRAKFRVEKLSKL